MVHAGARLGVDYPVPQVERPVVVAERLGVGVHRLGLRRRADRPRQRVGQVAGTVPVHRDLSGRARPARLSRPEPLGQGGVQPGAFAGQQLAVDRLLYQRVPEGVGVLVGSDDQQLLVDRLPQASQQLGLAQRRHRGQQMFLHSPPGRRHDCSPSFPLRTWG